MVMKVPPLVIVTKPQKGRERLQVKEGKTNKASLRMRATGIKLVALVLY